MGTGQAERASHLSLRDRAPALLALAIPCVAGLAFLALFKAPANYMIINGIALAAGLVWIATAPPLSGLRPLRIIALLGLLVLAAPLVTGPHIDGIARWVALGGFQLHAGMLVIPLLATVAASDRSYGPPLLLAAGLICLLQPDAASLFALTGAATGLYFAWHCWKPGLAAVLLFLASLNAAVRGELPPQPFVERVLVEVALVNLPFAAALFLSLLAGFAAILASTRKLPETRYALAGAFAGFSIMAVLSHYPSILIGYGASPIIGFALALGLHMRSD
jgi:hypothetical protein